jgi:mono/diheme cytochrome c family protein
MSISRRNKSTFCLSMLVLSGVLLAPRGASADAVLDIVIGGDTRQFSRDALLRRPDVASVEIADDVSYHKAMSYRAVRLAALLAAFKPPTDSVIEAVALDGFAAQLPLDLITNTDPAKPLAWLAIEAADAPWPPLPGQKVSAGPFYILWTGASAGTIRSEQWPYQVAKLASQPSPAARWPALGVDPALPATDPVRAGQALFVTQCLPCHNLNGAGAGAIGPELNRPMNPTEYLTRAGLHALIRDPKSVRNWPEQRMPGFAADQMSDREIDLVISYLAHMTTRRTSP